MHLPEMTVSIVVIAKPFIAALALDRFFPGVRQYMPLQLIVEREYLGTHRTVEFLLRLLHHEVTDVVLDLHVSPQRFLLLVLFVAKRALELPFV